MNILICGDSFKSITGLSEVAIGIFKYFKLRNYKVAYCIIEGKSCTDEDVYNNIYLQDFSDFQFYNSSESQENFDKVILDFKPHIVFSINDPWKVDNIAFSTYRDTYKWIHYCPIEGNHYSEYLIYPDKNSFRKSLKEVFNECDLIIPYTQIGQMIIKRLTDKNNVTTYLYNGIQDIDIVKVDRHKIFKGHVKDDDFLFMTTGTNFRRKGIDYIIEAFHLYLQSVDNPEKYKLYIHGNLDTFNSATDIKSMVKDLDILNNVIYSSKNQLSKYELYERYKCADCYIGLPLADGFGLGFAEAMLNKIPIIAHDYGGYIEYIQQYEKVSSCANYYPDNHFSLWKIPNIKETVQAMKVIVQGKHKYDYTSENYHFAKSNLIWEKIYEKLDIILKDILTTYREDIVHSLQIRRVI